MLDPETGAHQGTFRIMGQTDLTVDDVLHFQTPISVNSLAAEPMGLPTFGTDGADALVVDTQQWLDTSDGDDTVTVLQESRGAHVDLGAGDDSLDGTATTIFVDPGEGDDTVHVGIGSRVEASDGADIIRFDLSDMTDDNPVATYDFQDEIDQVVIDLPESGGPVVEITVIDGAGAVSSPMIIV